MLDLCKRKSTRCGRHICNFEESVSTKYRIKIDTIMRGSKFIESLQSGLYSIDQSEYSFLVHLFSFELQVQQILSESAGHEFIV